MRENKWKLYDDIRKDSGNRIAADLRDKEKRSNYVRNDSWNELVFNDGLNWYNSGLPLEEAPEDKKNNIHFINGFKKGLRLALIAELQANDSKSRK